MGARGAPLGPIERWVRAAVWPRRAAHCEELRCSPMSAWAPTIWRAPRRSTMRPWPYWGTRAATFRTSRSSRAGSAGARISAAARSRMPSGSASRSMAGRRDPATAPCSHFPPARGSRWIASMPQRWRTAAPRKGSRGCVPATARTSTPPTCAIRTATSWPPCAGDSRLPKAPERMRPYAAARRARLPQCRFRRVRAAAPAPPNPPARSPPGGA